MYLGMRTPSLRTSAIALELGIFMFVAGITSMTWPWAFLCAAVILVGNVGTIVLIGRKDSEAPLATVRE